MGRVCAGECGRAGAAARGLTARGVVEGRHSGRSAGGESNTQVRGVRVTAGGQVQWWEGRCSGGRAGGEGSAGGQVWRQGCRW